MTPRIPYLELPDLVLIPAHTFGDFPAFPIGLKPFGTLVALGLYAGAVTAVRQARRLGASDRVMSAFLTWIVVSSFVCAHVLDALFYYPEEVRRDPWMLLRLWEGLSSFGGFVGAIVGGFAFRFWYRMPIFAYSDIVASAFPVSWAFGRLGCTFAHDHPGIASDAWYAVRYPGGGRLDLGLFELLITLPLMVVFLFLQRRPRPWGFYAGVMCTYYAPLRFALDFLRERAGVPVGPLLAGGDARYLGLTPAQWACLPMLALGIALLVRSRRAGTELPPIPEAFQTSGAKPERAAGDARGER